MKYFLTILVAIGLSAAGSTANAETLRELPSCYDGLGDIWGEKEARIRMRKLDGAAIKSAQDFARMTGARDVSLKLVEGGDFAGWDFRDIPLHQVCFMESDLKRANFAGAEGTGIGFIKSDLAGADMQGAIMPQVMFRNANLKEVNAAGANFYGGHFDGGWFEGSLEGWHLDGATLTEFIFDCGITVPDGCPVERWNISFNSTDLTRADISSFGFYEADTRDAIIDHTIISPRQVLQMFPVNLHDGVYLKGGDRKILLEKTEFEELLDQAKIAESGGAPSFDCKRAKTVVEKTICNESNDDLRALDRRVAATFKQVIARTSDARTGQRAWLKERDRCNAAKIGDQRNCILEAYTERFGELVGMLGEQDWLKKGEDALFVSERLPLPKAFHKDPLYRKITPALIGASMTEILIKRAEDGLYSIRGSAVGANAHLCSLGASHLYLDKETGWYIPVREGAAVPIFRIYDGQLEIFAGGRPDSEKYPDAGNYMSCGMRASFNDTIRIEADDKTMAAVRKSLEETM